MDRKFSFPHHTLSLNELEEKLKTRSCLVVSFFGKTPHAAKNSKGSYIDDFVGREVFSVPSSDIGDKDESSNLIEGYFDNDRDVVFLHMVSWMDTFAIAEKCKEAEDYLVHKSFLSFWSGRRYEHALSLLFLFHVSHILVCCQPGHTFDISYIHLFKSLDNLRAKIQPAVSEVLKQIPGLSKDWINHGRPCSPRVLFLFLSAPVALRGSRGLKDERRDAKPHKHPPIKRLEFSLEDQIYRILRKARIITNISANSLFAVPSNQEFVYVETNGDKMDPEAFILNNFFAMMNGEMLEDEPDPRPFYHQYIVEEKRPKRCFARFLRNHINVGFEKGFSDNLSKHGGHSGMFFWEVPFVSEWVQLSTKLFNLFTADLSSSEGQKYSGALMNLRDDLETEIMFSELRCKKILPAALACYTDGLPPHYTADYHNAKLLQAMSMYSIQARGPASEKFAEVLAQDCTSYWQSGRQMCEEISLTGNHCTNRRHTLPGQDNLAEDKDGEKTTRKILPTMQHSSGVQYVAACNCGRRQANREDPFRLVDANCNFYQQLEEECCKDLEHVSFPEYRPVKSNPTVAVTAPTQMDTLSPDESNKVEESPSTDSGVEQSQSEDQSKKEESTEAVNGPSEETIERGDTPAQDETDIILEVLENVHISDAASTTGPSPGKVASLITRQVSEAKLEYLPHMKTITSPPGLLPDISSWSLVLVGSSHLYSHSSGLGSQPGFMSSSKFLLPWEVPLAKVNHKTLHDRWPNIAENAAKRASLRTPDEPFDNRITVKVFIGFEYECLRGHRFMISAPDKPMKSSSTMREAASKLVTSDLPLYMACPCRTVKPPVAQLTRVHIVTPKAPVYVTLQPTVQPTPGGPVFVTGWDTPHKLSINSYWVLRLPYVYSGEGGAHLPPVIPPEPTLSGAFLKGAVSVDEDFIEG